MNKVFEQLKREARTALTYPSNQGMTSWVRGRANMAHQLGAISLDALLEIDKML